MFKMLTAIALSAATFAVGPAHADWSIAQNALTQNALTQNALAPTGSAALDDLNGVTVEAVSVPPETAR